MTRIERGRAAVDAARALLLECSGALSPAPDDEVVELLSSTAELARLVEAQQVRLAAEVAERSTGPTDEALCRRIGQRTARSALASVFGVRSRHAAELLSLAAATRPSTGLSGGAIPARLPKVAEALREGALSLAQAQAILQSLEPAIPRADPDELAWAETALVHAAVDPAAPLVPELLAVQGRAYAAVLDPDGVLPGEERQRAMRSLRLGRRADGMWQLTMVCPPEQGSAIKTVLDAYTGPRVPVRFHDPEAPGSDEGASDVGQAVADGRTPEQLRHDVLVGIVQAHAASGEAPTAGGEPPTLVLHGSADALRAALDGVLHRERFARIEHTGDLVPIEVALRMVCDAKVQLAEVDPRHRHVLQLGRAQRLFTRAQRRALSIRDGGCRAPGCQMPPSWCEAHHVLAWLLGGPTDVGNGILLCSYHHHEVHAGRLRVERAGAEQGAWRVVAELAPLRRTSAWRAEQRVLARRGVGSCASPPDRSTRERRVRRLLGAHRPTGSRFEVLGPTPPRIVLRR